MKSCLECGQELVRHQKKFCGVRCQHAHERAARTRKWLETGVVPNIGGLINHYIRRYIFEDQQRCCAICGSPAHWMGMRLILVLDHIDGDSTNNARENLRMVCPNCDSQLPTFKSKNRGNGRHFRRERYANGQSY
jgi:hypothetical protein